jgi:hypothetical protein
MSEFRHSSASRTFLPVKPNERSAWVLQHRR